MSARPELPSPERAAEDAFLESWRQRDDIDGLVDCITTALEEGRPQLAGRLVGLLDGRIQIPPGSALERAQQAARLLVVARPEAEPRLAEELDRAWFEARRDQLRRIRARVRARNQEGSGVFLDRGAPRRRRSRFLGRKRRDRET